MKAIFVFIVTFSVFGAHAQISPIEEAKARCQRPDPSEPIVKQEDFSWDMTRDQILAKSENLYKSGKRLMKRAYYDAVAQAFVMPGRTGDVRVPEKFILNVIGHVEESLRLNYIDAVIFPDLGHSHFFVPADIYDREIRPLPGEVEAYEKMFALPELKVIYHTGEQLKFKDENETLLPDELIRWRYYVRNIVGDNSGARRIEIHLNPTAKFNTVKDLNGYEYYGAGFNISSSESGCFAYQDGGRRRYFDLSLHDLPTDRGNFSLQRLRRSRH